MILNRLKKNHRKLMPWAQRHNIDAYRLYDRDIPEFPFIVDIYSTFAVVYDKSDPLRDKNKNHLPLLLEALSQGLGFEGPKVIVKRRQRQEGLAQYEKLESRGESFVIREHDAHFEINLFDYLDTGLFLDHRPMRQKLYRKIKALLNSPVVQPRLLNLFCYTGSVSVFGALAGASVVSVDMSATYLEWAKRNFKLNHLDTSKHEFLQQDVLAYLRLPPVDTFDFIFLDPPTFSNSKRMTETFDVERDQETLIALSMKRLAPEGTLYFSNNKRGFRLSEKIKSLYSVRDITESTIPPDFHDKKIHSCFEIRFSP